MAGRAGLDRAAVLQAAAELVDERGPDKLTLSELAQRLGVRTPSLYNYFPGQAGLRRELALAGLRLLSACLSRAAVGKSRDEAVFALGYAMRDFILKHPGQYALIVQPANLGEPEDRELAEASEEVVAVVLAVIASFGLHGAQAVHAVRGLRSVVHGFTTLEAAGGFGLPLDSDESFRQLLEVHVRGLHGAAEEPRAL